MNPPNAHPGISQPMWGSFPQQRGFNRPTDLYPDTNVIQTNKVKTSENKISYRLFIQGHDRDTLKFPNPNSFSVTLPDEYRDVVKVCLKNCQFPIYNQNIRKNNNIFYFQETPDTISRVRIPPGQYAAASLVAYLQAEISAISLANITVSLTSNDGGITNYFTFQSDFANGAQFFRILTFDPSCLTGGTTLTYYNDQKTNQNRFEPLANPIFPILGFVRKDYLYLPGYLTGYAGETILYSNNLCLKDYYTVGRRIKFQDTADATVYTITGFVDEFTLTVDVPLVKDHVAGIVYMDAYTAQGTFQLEDNFYLMINVKEMPYFRNVSPFFKPFLYIVHDTNIFYYSNFLKIVDGTDERYFNPPIAKLNTLTFEFYDFNGELYAFQNDHFFLDFEITCLNSPPQLLPSNETFTF